MQVSQMQWRYYQEYLKLAADCFEYDTSNYEGIVPSIARRAI